MCTAAVGKLTHNTFLTVFPDSAGSHLGNNAGSGDNGVDGICLGTHHKSAPKAQWQPESSTSVPAYSSLLAKALPGPD